MASVQNLCRVGCGTHFLNLVVHPPFLNLVIQQFTCKSGKIFSSGFQLGVGKKILRPITNTRARENVYESNEAIGLALAQDF